MFLNHWSREFPWVDVAYLIFNHIFQFDFSLFDMFGNAKSKGRDWLFIGKDIVAKLRIENCAMVRVRPVLIKVCSILQ